MKAEYKLRWVPTDCGGVWPNGERWGLEWLNPRVGYYQQCGRVYHDATMPSNTFKLWGHMVSNVSEISEVDGRCDTMAESAKCLIQAFYAWRESVEKSEKETLTG